MDRRLKVAFVVQRYGLEVNGGSELYCRQYAEKLKDCYDVEVLTTCALDYTDWKNHYEEGLSDINGVNVRRFKVDTLRNMNEFRKTSEYVYSNKNISYYECLRWMYEQGPICNGLLKYLECNKDNYDVIIFMTYLYYTTYFGIHIAPEKSILIPTAHDEPPIYLNIFNSVFHLPRFIGYNTIDEKKFIIKRFNNVYKESDILGVGIDIPEDLESISIKERFDIDRDYILYVGRIDESKGCKELFEYFNQYIKDIGRDVKLVLMGKPVMEIPKDRNIISLGFVTDEEKFNGIMQSKLVIIPSKYESLSMILLESMKLNKPVLVNGQCEVLKTHCKKSNAGLYYTNYTEFKECLELLLENENLSTKMGENGERYVYDNYDWDVIIAKLTNAINFVAHK